MTNGIIPFKNEDLIEIDQNILLTKNPVVGFKDLFDNKPNVVVAGGLWRALLMGEYINDLDVFWINDPSEFYELGKEVLGKDISGSSMVSGHHRGTKYQFVNRKYDSVEHIFKSFDYTICLFAYSQKKLFSTELAMEDSRSKRLRINIVQPHNNLNTLKRMVKYVRKGYYPKMEDLIHLSQGINGLDMKELAEQIQFDGNGYVRDNEV